MNNPTTSKISAPCSGCVAHPEPLGAPIGAPKVMYSGRGRCLGRVLRRAVSLDRGPHRLLVNPQLSEQAGSFFITDQREQQVANTKLSATVVERTGACGHQQPACWHCGRYREPRPAIRPRCSGLGCRGRLRVGSGKQRHHRVADRLRVRATADQYPRGDTLVLASQTEEEVLGADVLVTEVHRLPQRQLHHLLSSWRERNPAGGGLVSRRDHPHHLLADVLGSDAKRPQNLPCDAVRIVKQTEELVLGADVAVPESARLLLRHDKNLASRLCKSLEHSPEDRTTAKTRQQLGDITHTRPSPATSTVAHVPVLWEAGRGCRRPLSPAASRPLQGRVASFPSLRPVPLGRLAAGSGFVNHRIPTSREPKMSASAPAVNSVTLVGNLTSDPVLKQLDDDRKICQLRLAVNDQKDQPMFIDVATFGAQADACARYLTKGRAVAVTGRLVYREWDDNGTRRSRHHIIGRVQFGGRPDEPAAETQDATEEAATF